MNAQKAISRTSSAATMLIGTAAAFTSMMGLAIAMAPTLMKMM